MFMGLTNNLILILSRRMIMRCVFVLDLFNGKVVHAVRGERRLYRPVEEYSKVVSSSDPISIIKKLSPQEIYIADLNRIQGLGENLMLIRVISSLTKTMADIGVSSDSDIDLLMPYVMPILGTETAGFELIRRAAESRPDALCVSIDMKNREVLTPQGSTRMDPFDMIMRLNSLDIREVILLELDRVGTAKGIDREFLIMAASISRHPLILGGGVKDESDLDLLEEIGISAALVATAVHDGRIGLDRLNKRLNA
jgi:phosphoribosylformimino-5-aminoimidazole carboxamide ribotide isomerase